MTTESQNTSACGETAGVGTGDLLGVRREMRVIQNALDHHKVTTEPFCGRGATASRVEWVLRRNAILEARCKEWAEKYNAAMALAEMEKKTKVERGEMVVELRTVLTEADEILTEMGWHTDRGLLHRIRAAHRHTPA